MVTQKTDQKSEVKHIESTIEILDEHVKKESLTGVSNSISAWIKTLVGHDELKDIANDLEDLKSAISEKDGKKIVSMMTKLGIATTKAADTAEDDEASKIKMLGKALTSAAKAISKFA